MSVMKEIFTLLEELYEEPKEEEGMLIDLSECKNEGKGFTTLIPDEVYAKVQKLFEDFKDLRETMADNTPKVLMKLREIPPSEHDYAMLEFVLFTDLHNELGDAISNLVAVHEIGDKDHVEEECKKQGITPQQFLRMKMLNSMFGL